MVNYILIVLSLWSFVDERHYGQVYAAPVQNSSRLSTYKGNGKICQTESCSFFNGIFLEKLDYTLDPCDDFYEFSCRNQLLTVELIADNLIKSYKFELIKMLNDTSIDVSENLKRLRNLYKSCITPNPNNMDSLTKLIKRLGGLPLGGHNSGWNDQVPFDWMQTTIKFRRLGIDHDLFFYIGYGIDDDTDVIRLSLGIPDTEELPYLDRSIQVDLITSLYKSDGSFVKQQIRDVRQFRRQLLKIQNRKSGHGSGDIEKEGETPAKISLDSLELEIPDVNWKTFLGDITDTNLNHKDHILVYELDKMNQIVTLVSKTDPNLLANHMMLTIIETYAPYVINPGSGEPLHHDIKPPDCNKMLEDYLGFAFVAEYYKKWIGRDTIALLAEMIKSLQTEIKLIIDEAQWIADDKTKLGAKAKIDSMTFEIGLAEKLIDPKTTEWFYSGLILDLERPIENLMKIRKAAYDRIFADFLNQPDEDLSWTEYDNSKSIIVRNADYCDLYNKIRILPGHITPIHLDPTRLSSINFGLMSTVIGHEMMHAFDVDGIKRDNNRLVTRWFDDKSRLEYKRRAKCLRKQYDGYKVETDDGDDEWLTDGKLTLSENIADNAGVEAAYRAFERWLQFHHNEPELIDGVSLDAKQLFWVSYAQDWCTRLKHEKKDTHSPNKLRVNIPLSNYKEFSRDFNCPIGSRMNPEYKCELW